MLEDRRGAQGGDGDPGAMSLRSGKTVPCPGDTAGMDPLLTEARGDGDPFASRGRVGRTPPRELLPIVDSFPLHIDGPEAIVEEVARSETFSEAEVAGSYNLSDCGARIVDDIPEESEAGSSAALSAVRNPAWQPGVIPDEVFGDELGRLPVIGRGRGLPSRASSISDQHSAPTLAQAMGRLNLPRQQSLPASVGLWDLRPPAPEEGPPPPRGPVGNLDRPLVPQRVIQQLPLQRRAKPGPLKQLDNPAKVGDASVQLVNVGTVPVGIPSPQHQNFFSGIWRVLAGHEELVVVGNHHIIITGRLDLPEFRGQVTFSDVQSEFNRTADNDAPPRATQITFDTARQVGRVNPAVFAQYCPGGLVNQREVAAVLRGEYHLENAMANRIVPLLREDCLTYDNATLSAIAFFLLDYISCLDRLGIGWVAAPAGADRISYLNIGVPDGQADASMTILTEAVVNGRLCMRRREVTAQDIRCMQFIGTGPPYVLIDDHHRARPIHHYFVTPNINWLVWDTVDHAPVGPGVVTYADMFSFILKLTHKLVPLDQSVRGFLTAQLWANGSRHRPDVTRPDCFITATLEVEEITAPGVRGRSLVWCLLTDQWTMDSEPLLYEREWDTIVTLNTDQRTALGAAAAAVVSVCVSTAFHHYNINGRCLNTWALRLQAPVTVFLRQMLDLQAGYKALGIYIFACNAITEMTGLHLNLENFYSHTWCGMWNNQRPILRTEIWEGIWQRDIPYTIRPESLEWLVAKWLFEWGLNGPNPTYNISKELLTYSSPNVGGLYIYRGDEKYYETRQSRIPSTYVGYGAFFYNTLAQDTRSQHRATWSFRPLARSSVNDVMEEVDLERGVVWQPRYHQATFHIIPGTLKTFDWDRQVLLAPILLSRDLPDQVWRGWRNLQPKEHHSHAGFVMRATVPDCEMLIDSISVMRDIAGGNSMAAVGQGATAQENEEN